jgi:uncharacterized hydrophobic protein (TIGR00341 family)
MRLIEATFPCDYRDRVASAVADAEPVHWRAAEDAGDGRCVVRVLVAPGKGQKVVDVLQSILDGAEDWRVVVLPVEATAPKLEEDEEEEESEDEKKQRQTMALREEIYQDVSDGARLGPDFFVLTVLSTVVAAIGLNADNVAVVIGAMVIAPLLGPILAFSFAGALGDLKLMLRAARVALAGLAAGVFTAVLIGMNSPVNLASRELATRADLGLDSVALALASGAAAALSILTGISSALVGVMVAVALVPPAAAIGLFLGAGEPALAAKAAALLAVNVVCVNLAAQVVYAWKGVHPRTWLERQSAARSRRINLAVWAALLLALVGLVTWMRGL